MHNKIFPRPSIASFTFHQTWLSRKKITVLIGLLTLMFSSSSLAIQFSLTSTNNLNEKINLGLGKLGTYLIYIPDGLSVISDETQPIVKTQLAKFSSESPTKIVRVSNLNVTCPFSAEMKSTQVLAYYNTSKTSSPRDLEQDICFPQSESQMDIREFDLNERGAFGSGYVVPVELAEEYAKSASVSSEIFYLISTNDELDSSTTIREELTEALKSFSARQGTAGEEIIDVVRIDQVNQIRGAARASTIVVVSTLVVLVMLSILATNLTQSRIVRDRYWKYGIARTFGASKKKIFSSVLIEATLVAGIALFSTSVVILAAQGFADRVAKSLIGSQLETLSLLNVVLMAIVVILSILVASIAPALRAMNSEPIDLFE